MTSENEAVLFVVSDAAEDQSVTPFPRKIKIRFPNVDMSKLDAKRIKRQIAKIIRMNKGMDVDENDQQLKFNNSTLEDRVPCSQMGVKNGDTLVLALSPQTDDTYPPNPPGLLQRYQPQDFITPLTTPTHHTRQGGRETPTSSGNLGSAAGNYPTTVSPLLGRNSRHSTPVHQRPTAPLGAQQTIYHANQYALGEGSNKYTASQSALEGIPPELRCSTPNSVRSGSPPVPTFQLPSQTAISIPPLSSVQQPQPQPTQQQQLQGLSLTTPSQFHLNSHVQSTNHPTLFGRGAPVSPTTRPQTVVPLGQSTGFTSLSMPQTSMVGVGMGRFDSPGDNDYMGVPVNPMRQPQTTATVSPLPLPPQGLSGVNQQQAAPLGPPIHPAFRSVEEPPRVISPFEAPPLLSQQFPSPPKEEIPPALPLPDHVSPQPLQPPPHATVPHPQSVSHVNSTLYHNSTSHNQSHYSDHYNQEQQHYTTEQHMNTSLGSRTHLNASMTNGVTELPYHESLPYMNTTQVLQEHQREGEGEYQTGSLDVGVTHQYWDYQQQQAVSGYSYPATANMDQSQYDYSTASQHYNYKPPQTTQGEQRSRSHSKTTPKKTPAVDRSKTNPIVPIDYGVNTDVLSGPPKPGDTLFGGIDLDESRIIAALQIPGAYNALQEQKDHHQKLKLDHEAVRESRELEFLHQHRQLEEQRMQHAVDAAKLQQELHDQAQQIERLRQQEQLAAGTCVKIKRERELERHLEETQARELERKLTLLENTTDKARQFEVEEIRRQIERQTEIQKQIQAEKMWVEAERKERAVLSAEQEAYLHKKEHHIDLQERALETEWVEIEHRRKNLDTLKSPQNKGTPSICAPTMPMTTPLSYRDRDRHRATHNPSSTFSPRGNNAPFREETGGVSTLVDQFDAVATKKDSRTCTPVSATKHRRIEERKPRKSHQQHYHEEDHHEERIQYHHQHQEASEGSPTSTTSAAASCVGSEGVVSSHASTNHSACQQDHHAIVQQLQHLTDKKTGGQNLIDQLQTSNDFEDNSAEYCKARLMLQELAQDLGKESLQFDKNNTCVVAVHESYTLLITYDPTTTRLYMYATVATTLPEDKLVKLELCEYLLEHSMLGLSCAGGSIGISLKNNFILLATSMDVTISKVKGLRNMASSFVDSLTQWRAHLATVIQHLQSGLKSHEISGMADHITHSTSLSHHISQQSPIHPTTTNTHLMEGSSILPMFPDPPTDTFPQYHNNHNHTATHSPPHKNDCQYQGSNSKVTHGGGTQYTTQQHYNMTSQTRQYMATTTATTPSSPTNQHQYAFQTTAGDPSYSGQRPHQTTRTTSPLTSAFCPVLQIEFMDHFTSDGRSDGVQVVHVERNGPAAYSGVHVSNIISSVESTKVTACGDWPKSSILANLISVELLVSTEGSAQRYCVTIPVQQPFL